MGPKDVIRGLISSNDIVLNTYLGDLSDADLVARPVPGANHIAWQLGHLINSEQNLLKMISGCSGIELPAGFAEQHSKEMAPKESTAGFRTKAEYQELYKKSRANALKNLDAFDAANLDKATEGRMAQLCPTLGALWVLVANHPMMHAGQFVVMRRKLGKPVTI